MELSGIRKESEALSLLEEAIESFRQALSVYTRDEFKIDWADTQNNIGLAFFAQAKLNEKTKARILLEKSISAFRAALGALDEDEFAGQVAVIKSKLAEAQADLLILSKD